jgi:hypothetical protein
MPHPTNETLIGYIEKQLNHSERTIVEKHLSGPCTRCTQRIDQLSLILKTISHDQTVAPPLSVLGKSIGIFYKRSTMPSQKHLRVLAKLIFDNHMQIPQMAVRGANPISAHQMLYSAQQVDIDLQITPDRGKHNLVGQILGSEQTKEMTSAFVCLKSENGVMLEGTETDSLGQFTFRQIPAGVYDLVFDLESQEVAITSLEFGNDK